MAQLTFYLPTELEELLRERARTSGKSLSAFITELVEREVRSEDVWSQAFLETYGSWQGKLEEPEDRPPEPSFEPSPAKSPVV